MPDAIAFFITFTTYGTWLPGDRRGSNQRGLGFRQPDGRLERKTAQLMTERAKILTWHQRKLVERQIIRTCAYRGWTCHAVNCRTNHVHILVTATGTLPKKVRVDLKAWCTRRLKEDALPDETDKWWSERGSLRFVFDKTGLERVKRYILTEQSQKRKKNGDGQQERRRRNPQPPTTDEPNPNRQREIQKARSVSEGRGNTQPASARDERNPESPKR